ncbi:HugZ family pyridoxamine 5'-phosphate oxidase [Azospirillum canadense]|uniref:HugZ family pyridoxamine 5'-phosphate oxidase n=1 Tax=Azospirillum canadense TaxID=403962 RepID=UPI002226BF91|nr:DUF2470 domain-containing protein [Azospirillum canadense]MCW2242635.1 putative heme iron utilization protein [Azospirillum canadense]
MSSDQPSNAGGPSGPGVSASSDASTVAASSVTAGDAARRVMRAVDRAALATALRGEAEGWPYPSLVQVALDLDGTPLLLLSTLADHTKNIASDPRVGLLFDGTLGLAQPLAQPLAGSRVSVIGRAERSEEPRHRARFLARHPAASFYAGFGDFAIYAVSVERAHHVAGFGRVHWIERADLLPYAVPAALAEAEGDILAHMNADHADAVRLYATVLAGVSGGAAPNETAEQGWTMTGLDPDGCDLRCGGTIARVDFDQRVDDPASARVNLAGLARRARQTLPPTGTTGVGTGSPGL